MGSAAHPAVATITRSKLGIRRAPRLLGVPLTARALGLAAQTLWARSLPGQRGWTLARVLAPNALLWAMNPASASALRSPDRFRRTVGADLVIRWSAQRSGGRRQLLPGPGRHQRRAARG